MDTGVLFVQKITNKLFQWWQNQEVTKHCDHLVSSEWLGILIVPSSKSMEKASGIAQCAHIRALCLH